MGGTVIISGSLENHGGLGFKKKNPYNYGKGAKQIPRKHGNGVTLTWTVSKMLNIK